MGFVLRASQAVFAIALVAAAAGDASLAQEPDTQGPGAPNMPSRRSMCQMDEHIDGDLAYLKAEIKIAEAQTPQWNIFAQAFRAEREKRARLCRQAMAQAREMRSASLPDAIKMAEDQLAQRLDSLRAMRVAVQPLYESLSPEQKKSADQIMRGGQIF